MSFNHDFNMYQEQAALTWTGLTGLVGVKAASLLVRRGIWLTCGIFTEAERISCTDRGIILSGLNKLEPALFKEVVDQFNWYLYHLLSRLVGEEIATKQMRQAFSVPAAVTGDDYCCTGGGDQTCGGL